MAQFSQFVFLKEECDSSLLYYNYIIKTKIEITDECKL